MMLPADTESIINLPFTSAVVVIALNLLADTESIINLPLHQQ
jgi:hypothetical protein